jgi:nucleotide-binding universal stress UspA family protein
MKKVLIAMDYNPAARGIAEAGHSLARSMNAEVTLLHVIADYTYYSSLDYSPITGFDSFSNLGVLQTSTIAELQKAAEEYLGKMKEYLGDNTIRTLTRDGDTGDAILGAATELNADMIVMGTHSRRGLEKILMGSVAEKVLRHSQVPMYIIPTRNEEEK